MSLWDTYDITTKVNEILGDVPLKNEDGHHYGRPYMSAYQLAIEFERRYPEDFAAIDKEVGGAGAGPGTLAQYLAKQLSRQIGADGDAHPVEGAFLSNVDVVEYRFRRQSGDDVVSSVSGGPSDLSMFRRRATSTPTD